MRLGIISDVHANEEALTGALEHLADCDKLFCLGDVVGYGPDPVSCVDILRDRDVACLRGNHDDGLLGELELEWFSFDAQAALAWQQGVVGADQIAWLEGLPRKIAFGDLTLVHGSPPASSADYVETPPEVRRAMERVETRVCAVGHTHVPAAFVGTPRPLPSLAVDWRDHGVIGNRLTIRVDPGQRLFFNAGSIGQPRDPSRQPTFAVWDTNRSELDLRRFSYDVRRTQEKILEAGLSWRLARRLARNA